MLTDYQSLKDKMRTVTKKKARKRMLELKLEDSISIAASKLDGDIRGAGGISVPTERNAIKRAQYAEEYDRLTRELNEVDTFLHSFAEYDIDAYHFFRYHFIDGLSQNEAVKKLGFKSHRRQALKLTGLEFYNEIVNGIPDCHEEIMAMECRYIKEIPKELEKDLKRFIVSTGGSAIDRAKFCLKHGISEATYYRYVHRIKTI